MTPDLRFNRLHLLFLTLGSTQSLMFEGCTLMALLPGMPEIGVTTLRPLLPGVLETGVTETACLVRHGSFRILLTEARQLPLGVSDNLGANPATMYGCFEPLTEASSCRRKNSLGHMSDLPHRQRLLSALSHHYG